VEIDPYDASSTPKKRTALGRLKHEAATVTLAADDRVVVYTGDDERFDYMYKFVSTDKYNSKDRKANLGLLDKGTLYVAKISDDGTGQWLPLVFGQGPLTAANGFRNQGDILINTRLAGDALGATKMDRPEDIETNPANGKVYAIMTNNTNRTGEQVNRANPRLANRHGHIIELTEGANDHAALSFRWDIFILAGDPKVEADGSYFAGYDKSKVSWLSCPDNLCFGAGGNMWIATDGAPGTLKTADGIYAVPVDGEERGFLRAFLSGPVDSELCGPEFNADSTTLFAAVQHPGEKGAAQ
jgi:secreted PhoX family phosphatase